MNANPMWTTQNVIYSLSSYGFWRDVPNVWPIRICKIKHSSHINHWLQTYVPNCLVHNSRHSISNCLNGMSQKRFSAYFSDFTSARLIWDKPAQFYKLPSLREFDPLPARVTASINWAHQLHLQSKTIRSFRKALVAS